MVGIKSKKTPSLSVNRQDDDKPAGITGPLSEETLTGADAKWGYKFACEGLASGKEVCESLGGISEDTLARICAAGDLRKGRLPNRRTICICRRSLREYIARLEV